MKPSELDAKIDGFITASHKLTGKKVSERPLWNTTVSSDAIQHFANGISDDNPLWTDPTYASAGPYGRLVAPPSFLTSVLYPILHGAPIEIALWSLIGGLEFEWFLPVLEGDRIDASVRQTGVFDRKDNEGRRRVYILSETVYWNQSKEIVAKAKGTMVRFAEQGSNLLVDRGIYGYRNDELAKIQEALKAETRTGAADFPIDKIEIHQALPSMVRGPLTIGDLVCWQAAIGPSYRGGRLGFLDTLDAPHATVHNPVTRWPIKYSQQHEDFLLASQRGMPAPFDNGVMRFAWLSPLLTDWIGDKGILKKLSVRILAPNLYGDTTWYSGTVTKKIEEKPYERIYVRLSGVNQVGITTTAGEAEVLVPTGKRTFFTTQLAPSRNLNREESLSKLTIPAMVEMQAKKNPDAPAIVCDRQTVSYSQMNQRANKIARHLITLAVAPNVSVGVFLDRSIEAIISFLAVLKAGGAYVPLDPEYPRERLDFMIRHSRVLMVLAKKGLAEKVKNCDADILYVDDIEDALSRYSDSNLCNVIQPNAPAYLMYTSGSTKHPRGVSVQHESLPLYIESLQASLTVKPEDRFVHTASFSFSASVRQTWLPLGTGAALIVTNNEQRRNPLALFALMKSESISVWDTVPTFLQNCVETLIAHKNSSFSSLVPDSLRLVLTTGEPLSWKLRQRWASAFAEQITLVNLYSQTETAGTVCLYPLPEQIEPQSGTVPLGLPLLHCQIYLLDDQLKPVVDGESGEICVGGHRLASHYIFQPDLTAERFVPDSFSGNYGGRLYRTGDLGRYRKDGLLEFVGRRDNRLKIRGFRIEPEEVSKHLVTHSQVENAITVSRDDGQGNSRLISYVVTSPEAARTVRGFRRRVLRNGLAIAEVNRHETDYSYQAIFDHQTYLGHRITIHDGDCIFDVGANIGLFTLFVSLIGTHTKIYCFEPNPKVYPLLQVNASLYAPHARLANFGLSCQPKTATFTSYADFSLISGFYADLEREQQVIKTFMTNAENAMSSAKVNATRGNELLPETALSAEQFYVPLKTLSMVIEEEQIDRLHLLKINAEKSEVDVLMGIELHDWAKIEQIVVKADTRENLDRILILLQSHGFLCEVEQDKLLTGTEIHTVYAIQSKSERSLLKDHKGMEDHPTVPTVPTPLMSVTELKSYLNDRLPDYMVPSAIVALESFPLTPTGKIDYSSLPLPGELGDARDNELIVSPRRPLETLIADIWKELLVIPEISITDKFLDLGGDSILALQFANRFKEKTGIQIDYANVLLKTLEQLASDFDLSQRA